jgi:hypothetical protein
LFPKSEAFDSSPSSPFPLSCPAPVARSGNGTTKDGGKRSIVIRSEQVLGPARLFGLFALRMVYCPCRSTKRTLCCGSVLRESAVNAAFADVKETSAVTFLDATCGIPRQAGQPYPYTEMAARARGDEGRTPPRRHPATWPPNPPSGPGRLCPGREHRRGSCCGAGRALARPPWAEKCTKDGVCGAFSTRRAASGGRSMRCGVSRHEVVRMREITCLRLSDDVVGKSNRPCAPPRLSRTSSGVRQRVLTDKRGSSNNIPDLSKLLRTAKGQGADRVA